MNPLPWANSVHPEFKVAQFMAQEARPQQPSPAPSWSSEVNPWMVTFCINEAKKSGAQEKMEELKQKIDKAEKTGNWLALSAYHEDFNLVQSALSAAEVAQMETMNKLRRGIEFMQKLLESWHETKNQFEDAKHKILRKTAEHEEEKKEKTTEEKKRLEEAQRHFEIFRSNSNLSDAEIIKMFEGKAKEAKAKEDSQPSQSSQQQEEEAKEATGESKAAD